MTKNYNYYFGGSLPLESGTYVKRQADDLLFQNLLQAKFSYVLNSRQMGKSSLMLRTKQRLENNGVGCVTIDLTDIGSQNIIVTQWYRGLVEQIVDDLELEIDWEQWWDQNEKKGISTVHMFGNFIRKALLPEVANNDRQAVIFVDEIDSIIKLDFGTDDFFAFIRACHNKRAEFPLYNCLTFCLLGVATPSDLIGDKTRTPFNIGTAIELTGFTFAEAKDALTPGLAEKVDDPEATLQQILDWTGGQPFLTQKLCNLVVNYAEASSPDISQLVQTCIINNWEEQDHPEHLRTIRDRILRNEEEEENTSRLLGLYSRVLSSEVSDDKSSEQMKLRLSGLVVKKKGRLEVYNPIYRDIFNRDWIESELAKLRKNPNYYFGGILPVESDTYVKRQADDVLFQNLLSGNFCWILNSRQTGKSSLILRIKKRLEKNGVGCVYIDLTTIGSQNITVTQWYRGVVKQIVDDLELEINWKKWWKEKQDEGISTVQLFGDFIREALLPEVASRYNNAVIFLDEIDIMTHLDFGTDDFFAFIRACHNKRAEFPLYNRLTFCLLGVATPSDLIADKTRTPFNIGTAIELTGFTFAGAKDALTQGLAERVDDPEATLQQILDWTGGQPFLTQKLCNLVVNYAEASSPDIPQLVQTCIINNWEEKDNPEHLRTIRDRILRNEQNTSRLLGLYRRVLTSEVATDTSPEQMELRLSGLVVKRNGRLQVYNPIYRGIFDRGWIEAELNKLRSYSEAINGWLKSGRQDASRLLRGETLEEALEWGREKNLSVEDYAFLSASQEIDRREREQALEIEKLEAIKKETELVIAEAKQGIGLERAGDEALEMFNSDQLRALLMAMKAGQALQKILERGSWQKGYPATSPLFALQQILAKIKERNQIPHNSSVNSVSFSPDGKMLATGSNDRTARLWDLQGNQIAELAGHSRSVLSVSFSPDGKMLATGSSDRTARLWDLQGNQIAELAGHSRSVLSVSFSPDGKMLATGSSDGTARLWDLQGNQIAGLAGHSDDVLSVSFSPDGKMLATGSDDGTARLWDLQGNQIAELAGHSDWVTSVSFSPDGKTLATASNDGTARLWDREGNEKAELTGHEGSVYSVSFSPDGKMLATGSYDRTARLWDLEGNLLAEFAGHEGSVYSVSFSPDGKMLATGSSDGTARLWPVENLEELLGRGCEWLQGYFVNHPEALAELEVCHGQD